MGIDACSEDRVAILGRALRLEYFTVGWNVVEGVVALPAAVAAGSVILVGFGVDSFVESSSGAVLIWRLLAERKARDPEAIERLDRRAHKLGTLWLFGRLAFVALDAAHALWKQDRPEPSMVGIALTTISLAVMMWLLQAKRRAARELGSRALQADAFQTTACWWLSLITLAGVGLNAALGWWWADPVAALGMTWFIAREGLEAWRGLRRPAPRVAPATTAVFPHRGFVMPSRTHSTRPLIRRPLAAGIAALEKVYRAVADRGRGRCMPGRPAARHSLCHVRGSRPRGRLRRYASCERGEKCGLPSDRRKGTGAAQGWHMEQFRKRQFTLSSIYFLFVLLGLVFVQSFLLRGPEPTKVPYSEFLAHLREGRVKEAELRADEILAKIQRAEGQNERVVASRLPGVDETRLIEELERRNVVFSGRIEKTSWLESLFFAWILPIALMIGVWSLIMRRAGKSGGPLTFGNSRVKIYDQARAERVTFDDVAGVDEAEEELVEVVEFLKNPSKYTALGARIPKGVLLVGPPGTGKTLLAKAVAGEAGVPFFSMSGSEFVEMFVGVGAARMRDLFQQAKERAPCIVFIDELDAIGKSRGGAAALATHDEREQTLNQLLVEMDGFDPGKGVVIMAATNRPEILDRALVRAGRFDRQVLVDRPDVKGREEILKVHARKVKLSESVDLKVIARRTPGMVGADLANVINEGALAAARRGSQVIEHRDLEEALDRVQLGLKKRNRAMNEEEKRRVAYHEGGHALVALSVEHADPVHRVTIIPRSIGALGATLQLPTEDRYLMTSAELLDRICVMLGGRAAEEIVCGNVSTGAQNDLERATETARQMVCRFGMSGKLGPLTYGRPVGAKFLEAPVVLGEERNFSEETARAIDEEVKAIIEGQHERARKILTERRAVLEEVARRLLDEETLEREHLDAIVGPRPERAAASMKAPTACAG